VRQVSNYTVGAGLVFGAYYLGVFVAHYTSVPIPGSLVGLLALLGVLFAFPLLERHVASFAMAPLKHMSLLFVPAVLGVTLYWNDIVNNALALFVAIVVTTALSLGVTAWSAQWLLSKKENVDG
jgi:holin-like protein